MLWQPWGLLLGLEPSKQAESKGEIARREKGEISCHLEVAEPHTKFLWGEMALMSGLPWWDQPLL